LCFFEGKKKWEWELEWRSCCGTYWGLVLMFREAVAAAAIAAGGLGQLCFWTKTISKELLCCGWMISSPTLGFICS
jgi:hypothetical protein